MMQRSGFWLGCLVAFALVSPARAAEDVDEARKAIEAGNAALMQAVAKGDSAAIAALYTKDAIVLPPGAEMIVGSKSAIESMFKELFAAGLKSFTLETINVERSGDMAAETGRFTDVMAPKGKPETKTVGKYVVVWKKESGGAWKLHRDIWNEDPTPTAPDATDAAVKP